MLNKPQAILEVQEYKNKETGKTYSAIPIPFKKVPDHNIDLNQMSPEELAARDRISK